MAIYVIKQKEVASLLLDLRDAQTYGKPPLFDIVNKKLEYFTKFVFFYGMFGTSVYNSIKIIDISECRKTRKIRETCGVLIPYWTPFDADDWYILTLLIIYVFFFVATIDRGVLCITLQVFEIACNIKLRIDQLNLMLLCCFNDRNLARRRLNACIYYHSALIK